MSAYRDINGGGSITSFEEGPTAIKVTFKGGLAYDYTYGTCGPDAVNHMIRLARQGSGLHGYIKSFRPAHVERKRA